MYGRNMIKVKEISLADIPRIYSYKKNSPYDISFSLKGFDYGWILGARDWHQGDKVLDVGGAYSDFPHFLHQHHRCETWVADDFGMGVDDAFWQRDKSPHEFIEQHPEIHYILERVGDPAKSSLPSGYFDVVYSASALEHVPSELTPAVWSHMLDLLKPGGELIHALDVLFPSNGGLKKMFQAQLFDAVPWLFSKTFKLKHYLATPVNYSRLVLQTLGVDSRISMKALNIWRMCLDPEIVVEPISFGWNRIVKDNMIDYHHHRFGSLLIHLIKN